MTMGTVTVEAQHELSAITATGNVTPHTIQFTNPETAFTTTGNVEVGKELTVTGNVAVDTDTLFVDTVNDRVGVGKTDPATALDVVGTVTATAFAGNASTASALATSVNIGGVAFDGSADITPTTFTAATFSGDVAFDTNTLFVDSTNNRVGVGTTSPDAALHVQTTGSGAIGGTVILNPNLNSSSVGLFLGKAVGAGTCMFMNYTHSGTDDSVDNTANFGIFSKSTNLTLKGNGNVGIGTTNPGYKLTVDGTIGTTDSINVSKNATYGSPARFSVTSGDTGMRFHMGTGGNGVWQTTGIVTERSGGLSGGGTILFVFNKNQSGGTATSTQLWLLRKNYSGGWTQDSNTAYIIKALNGTGSSTTVSFRQNNNLLEYTYTNGGNGHFYAIEFD
jgi:hypothetical protein